MSAPWLSIVGVGGGGLGDLPAVARALVAQAEVLVGSRRHLALIPEDGRLRIEWSRPIENSLTAIERLRGRRVCVLASGDPMDCGVGATLVRRISSAEMTVIPVPSAFSLACARLGWSRPDVECLSVHGRPLSLLHPFIQPGARLLILTTDGNGPGAIADLLRARGFGPSRLTVFERMGEAGERRTEGTAEGWNAGPVDELNTVAVDCAADAAAQILSRAPGLPDHVFRHDGQLTKREVRAVTLAALAPGPDRHLWDVGAGCGSVAIEWLRAERRASAVAIEQAPMRAAFIRDNAVALGVPELSVVEGQAPVALAGLGPPDAIFVGGGLDAAGLVEACWDALGPGGRIVANAVTVEGERRLAQWHAAQGGDLRRIAIARAEPMGGFTGWRALAPVTQLALVKR